MRNPALPVARAILSAALALVALPYPGSAGAQVYKCVDRTGHTTYQESPCTGGQQGAAVELNEAVTVRPGGTEPPWSAVAREGRIVVGMPKPFVTEALGAPAGIRAPRSGETGGEVWVYAKAGQTLRVGFLNNAVSWIRNDAAQQPAGTGAPAPANDRETRVREALAVGKTCTAALQEAGAPDRDESLSAGATTGTRYVYTFDESNANAYAAFICINGRVTSVERYIRGGVGGGGG